MAYRESYYEQREREKAEIKAAIQAQIDRQRAAEEAAPAVEESPVVEDSGADEVPDESWTKAAIQEWLDHEGIAWSSSMTKAELLELI